MDILWVVFSLIGVLGLFFVLIYALRKLNRGISVMSGGKMRIIDRVSVGRDGMLLVVSGKCGYELRTGAFCRYGRKKGRRKGQGK